MLRPKGCLSCAPTAGMASTTSSIVLPTCHTITVRNWLCMFYVSDVDCHPGAENKAVGVMKPGHTFTIEPMINMGTAAMVYTQLPG